MSASDQTNPSALRTSVTVIGPGAIGCALAAAIFEAGWEPTLVGRTPLHRLEVRHRGGSVEREVQTVTNPADVKPAKVTILATKATQTAAAGTAIKQATADGGVLVVAQNGLHHEARVAEYVGAGVQILPAVVNLPAHREAPGQAEVTGPARLTLAVGAGGEVVRHVFDGSFVQVRLVEDLLTQQWMKLIINASLGAVGVLVRRDNGYLADPDGRSLTIAVAREMVPIAQAEGAMIPDDLPDTMVETILGRAAGHVSSIVADRLAGLPTEWRERNAIIGELGRKHGLETPVNDLLTSLIRLGEPGNPAPAPIVGPWSGR